MFAKGAKALELERSGEWVAGAYVVQPWGTEPGWGWLVVLEGTGGAAWYATLDAAERGAAQRNRELLDRGLVWFYERSVPRAGSKRSTTRAGPKP